MFDKVFELIAKSTRFGFALAFAGTVFLAGNAYGWWPIKLPPENASYIIYATLLGYGILLAAGLANGFKIAYALLELLFLWLAKKRRERNVMDRLDELTPRQIAALWWISQNPTILIHGSIHQDPFKTLCAKGYLYATSEKAEAQGFKVHKQVFKKSSRLAERLPAHIVDQLPRQAAPWLAAF
ncbi:hypothetical protein ABIF07_003594 [Bradyrhizobium elkanii]|uniref:super-infection exclusion protein B n=1 Tax=Bradyrhizobium elkanii TaxID=29448 RepID=UPI00216A0B42|nr:super-infection exclusion protein B [Bradyrhizobium elkanii]MCS3689380.1 hypothetical protein [Bradyrhizobium elkanii]